MVARLLSVSIELDSARSQLPSGPVQDRLTAAASELQDTLRLVRQLVISCDPHDSSDEPDDRAEE